MTVTARNSCHQWRDLMRPVSLAHTALKLAAAAALTMGLSFTTLAQAQTVLKFGVASVNEGLLPLRIAADQGYFKDAGITAEFLDFRGGGPTVQAFASGSVDFCICA